MSAANAVRTRPTPRPQAAPLPPDLHLIEGKRPLRLAIPMAIVCVVLLVVAIITPMIVNTAMAQTSFNIREQQLKLNELQAQSWTLQTQLQDAASPVSLEKLAHQQGLVPAGVAGVITLKTGNVEAGKPAQ